MFKSILRISLAAGLLIAGLSAGDLARTLQVNNDYLNSYSDVVIGDNKFYFMGDNDDNGKELWVSNGSEAGTFMISDFNVGSANSNFYPIAILGDRLIFRDSARNLLYTDGTASTTAYIKDSYTTENNTTATRKVMLDYYTHAAKVGSKVFFTRSDVDSIGQELWMTDGDTTTLIKDIRLGTSNSTPDNFQVINDKLVFTAYDGTTIGYALWSSDGTTTGTQILVDYTVGTGNGSYYYLGKDATNIYFYTSSYVYDSGYIYTYKFYKTDGTAQGTKLIYSSSSKDDIAMQIDTSSTRFAVTDGGKIYFMASYKVYNSLSETWDSKGNELWISDGTQDGTHVIDDFNLGETDSNFNYFRTIGEKIIFRNGDDSGYHLWVSDGTKTGTKELVTNEDKSLYTYYYYYATSRYVSNEINGKIFFYAREEVDDKYGTELYVTDGTSAGTHIVKDIRPGSNSSEPQYFHEFKGEAYFQAYSSDYGTELWKSDGTKLGTQMVHDIWYGNSSSDFEILGAMNNILYLYARDTSNYDYNIWSTDGDVTIDENRLLDVNVTQAIEATKTMCKNDPASCGIATVAPALTAEKMSAKGLGWHMVGTSLSTDDMSAFGNVDTVWKWDGSKWLIYSPNPQLQSAIQNAGYGTINKLEAFDGVWIRNK